MHFLKDSKNNNKDPNPQPIFEPIFYILELKFLEENRIVFSSCPVFTIFKKT